MAQRKDFRRIGVLLPSSSSAQEWDIGRALPDDITLHVARMRTVDTTGGPHRRPILEITVPGRGRRRLVRAGGARADRADVCVVRDRSGLKDSRARTRVRRHCPRRDRG